MKITISGKKNKIPLSVKYEDGFFYFNGALNSKYEKEVKRHIKQRYPIGGTYYPKEDSDLNIINVLENHFFDKCETANIANANIEKIEYEEGKIY